MEQIEVFQILGIEPTKDERALKTAYREKLSVTNPEDNPEGFKRLRTAFEEACRLAREPEAVEGEEKEKEKDLSPSGIWVSKVADIYANIISRQDVEQWKALFAEDIFLSLEEEENCRQKLLYFLMDHYRLPSNVWKLLDAKLNIVKDKALLKEHFRVDFISFIVSKCERGEDVNFEQFEGEPNAPYDLFLQYYEQCYRALDAGQPKEAASLIEKADGLKIFHPLLEMCRADVYEKQGKISEAIELLWEMKERFPKDAIVCYNCAEMLWRNGRKQDAALVYEALKEECDSHYMSNMRLTEWYYEQKRYKDAKQCAEKVLTYGSDEHFLELLKKINYEIERDLEKYFHSEEDWEKGLELGWCYLQDGKFSKGIQLVLTLEKKITADRYAEYTGLLTKLYVEAADYMESVSMSNIWEQALQEKLTTDESEEDREKDRDRLRQVHMIRMQCYHNLGYQDSSYFVKAIEEAETVESGTIKDISLLLEKAYIYMEMREYEKSLALTRRLLEEYQIYAAMATSMEVYRRQWDAPGVVREGRACINHFSNYVRAYECVAKVYLDLNHTEELKELLQEAEKNDIQSVILDAYRYQMEHEVPEVEELNQKLQEFRKNFLSPLEQGRVEYYETGLPVVTEYLYWYPGAYMLVERGVFHRAAKHLEEAKKDFKKALAENPAQPFAFNGLSLVYKYQGDYEKALVCLKKAILYLGEDLYPAVYAELGDLYSLLGNDENALKAYEQFVNCAGDDAKRNAEYMKKLAMCLARCEQVDEAIKVLNTAFDNILEVYREQVHIYQVSGESKKAEALLEQWNKRMLNSAHFLRDNEYAVYYSGMAWQELLFGSGQKALELFEKVINCQSEGTDVTDDLCNLVFASILCSDDERGKLYAEKLRYWRAKKEDDGWRDYYNQEKERLYMNFLADYYKKSSEELDELLATEDNCQICHFCTYCICQELEAVRILHMLRKGEKASALARVESNLREQPLDENMLAIRHLCEGNAYVASKAADTDSDMDVHKGFWVKLAGLFGKKK